MTYIFITLILSCSFTKMKEKLIRNWYYYDGNKIDSEIKIYKNTVVMYNSYSQKPTLVRKLDSEKINTSYSNESEPVFKYKFHDNKFLKLRLIRNDLYELVKFIQAGNIYDFFHKLINLKIQLPTKETGVQKVGSNGYLNFIVCTSCNNNSNS